jgi:hypothetical protein
MQDDRPGGRAIGPGPHFVVGAAVYILGGAHVAETAGNVRSHKVLLVCVKWKGISQCSWTTKDSFMHKLYLSIEFIRNIVKMPTRFMAFELH